MSNQGEGTMREQNEGQGVLKKKDYPGKTVLEE